MASGEMTLAEFVAFLSAHPQISSLSPSTDQFILYACIGGTWARCSKPEPRTMALPTN